MPPEQMMLTLFRRERPDYTPAPEGANAVLLTPYPLRGHPARPGRPSAGRGEGRPWGGTPPRSPVGEDPLVRDRVCQRIPEAGLLPGRGDRVLGHEAPWGLPHRRARSKIPTRAMERGATIPGRPSGSCGRPPSLPGRAPWPWTAPGPACGPAEPAGGRGLPYIGIPFCPTRCAFTAPFVSADVGPDPQAPLALFWRSSLQGGRRHLREELRRCRYAVRLP